MKHPIQSRTIWTIILVRAVALVCPHVLDLMREFPEAWLILDGVILVALRMLTKTGLRVGPPPDTININLRE